MSKPMLQLLWLRSSGMPMRTSWKLTTLCSTLCSFGWATTSRSCQYYIGFRMWWSRSTKETVYIIPWSKLKNVGVIHVAVRSALPRQKWQLCFPICPNLAAYLAITFALSLNLSDHIIHHICPFWAYAAECHRASHTWWCIRTHNA